MRLTATGEGLQTGSKFFRASCQDTDNIGDAVCISGNRVGALYQVTKVNIDSADLKRARTVGFIRQKVSETLCYVQTAGEFPTTGLDPGALLFVNVNSKMSNTRPPYPITGTRIIQSIGTALATDVALIHIGPPMRVIPS